MIANFGRQNKKGRRHLLYKLKTEAGEMEKNSLEQMAEGGCGRTGRVSYSKAIKDDLSIHRPLALGCFLWPWKKLHSSEPRKNEKS